MSQLSYGQDMAVGRAGMLADNSDNTVDSKVNPGVAVPYGLAVCRLSTDKDRGVKLPTTAAEAAACVGVALAGQAVESQAGSDDPNYPIKSDVPVLRKGRVWVKVLEAVTPEDDVYVRYGDGVADTDDDQKGSFGKSADGTAQVDTITPTAADDTQYQVQIQTNGETYVYEVESGTSATATTITTALKAAINADTALHGVTATGTATTILTGGLTRSFKTIVGARLALVNTTPFASAAAKLDGAKYLTTAAEDGLVILELNLP